MREIEAGWPERVLTMQRNWIGQSIGAYVDFTVKDRKSEPIRVFTTRLDTIYGANAVVLAPEHPILEKLLEGSALKKDVMRFVERVKAGRATAPGTDEGEKEGINTGVFVINPFSGEQLPVWVANYVLIEYGTGAVMSVPAHDERDFEFAQKYSLPIHQVVAPITHDKEPSGFEPRLGEDQSIEMKHAFTDYGMLINSGEWSAKLSEQAMREMTAFAEERGFGGAGVTFRLRDWGISRQKFWGAPIPIIYCDDCGTVPVPEKDLPVELPEHAEFTGMGASPLARVAEFVNTICPKCGKQERRETNTMDTFVDSSWYFFRYADPNNESEPFDKEKIAYWLPVGQYIGGIEHAVMHLLYTRFWTKFMRDIGLVSFNEPVKNLLTQGMVTNIVEGTGEWKAMSKSLGNGVDPDEMIEIYGADAVRLFVLFAAPPENELRWTETGIDGAVRFLRRVYNTVWRWRENLEITPRKSSKAESPDMFFEYTAVAWDEFSPEAKRLQQMTHRTIQRVTNDFERLHFNTSVAALMELMNAIGDFSAQLQTPTDADRFVMREALEAMTVMLAPLAPHAAEEMWLALGHAKPLASGREVRWPQFDAEIARHEELEIPVQINGKLRARIRATLETSAEELQQIAFADGRVRQLVEGRAIVRVVVVPQRLVNIVIK